METFYFIRHAQRDNRIKEDKIVPLSSKGLEDSKFVTQYLMDKDIDYIYSSPYLRCIETIQEFTNKKDLKISKINDFRERKISNEWIEEFEDYALKQWNDFDYKLDSGESLNEVQIRNIKALSSLIQAHPNKNIVVSSHGTAISTMIHFFIKDFGFKDFMDIADINPFVLELKFDNHKIQSINFIDVIGKINRAYL